MPHKISIDTFIALFMWHLSALQTLGLAHDIDHLANEDVLGRQLQDASLATKSQRSGTGTRLKLPRNTGVIDNTFQANTPSLINQVMAKYKNKPPSDEQG